MKHFQKYYSIRFAINNNLKVFPLKLFISSIKTFIVLVMFLSNNVFAQIEPEACINYPVLNLNNTDSRYLKTLSTVSPYSASFHNSPTIGLGLNSMQNITFGGPSLTISNPFDIYINNDFTINENFNFFYCTIYFGPNAHIIVKNGIKFSVNDCHLMCCHGASQNNMWQGITVESGGTLEIQSSLIEDAMIAVDLENSSSFQCGSNLFNRNNVGINFQGSTINPVINNYGSLNGTYQLANCYFTTWHFNSAPTKLSTVNNLIAGAPYSQSQLNNGLNKIGYAGIVINNMYPFTGNTDFIIGTTQPTKPTYFQYLEYGIINNNSKLKVVQAEFNDLHISPGGSGTAGIGVYTLKSLSTNPITTIKVGEQNTSGSTKSCSFSNCSFGVYTEAPCQVIDIGYNTFINCFKAGIFSAIQRNGSMKYSSNAFHECLTGIDIQNLISPSSFSIDNNNFSKTVLTLPATSFTDVSIRITNRGFAPVTGNIINNISNDDRIGIYAINVSNLNIQNNYINFNRSIINMQNSLHYGIWIDNCPNSKLVSNHVICSQTSVSSATYKTLVRGFNLKRFSNSLVTDNEIANCGTAMRFVDACTFTGMKCNRMDNNGIGWYTQSSGSNVAVLSSQGSAYSNPGNYWSNTPAGCYKIDGSGSLIQFDYFHSGADVSNNPNSPNPYNPFILFDNCCLQSYPTCFRSADFLSDQDLMDYYNQTTLSAVGLDKAFTDIYMMFNKLPQLINQDQNQWILDHQFTLAAYYRLFNDSIDRSSIIDEFNNIPTSSYPELNQKKELFYTALLNELAGYDSLSYDQFNLSELAFTNIWDGTDAVFLARAILNLEVDDQELNLRVADRGITDCNQIILDYQGKINSSNAEVKLINLSDINGRKLFSFQITDDYNRYISEQLKTGIYIVEINTEDCHKVFKLVR